MSLGTLYSLDRLCPFTHRILIAKSELALELDVAYSPDIPDSVRQANVSGKWPVFVPENGEMLADSANIVDHLIAKSGNDAYRSDAATLKALNMAIQCISKVILAGKPRLQREFREKLDTALEAVERIRASSDGPFLGGEQFAQADGHIAPFLYRLPFLIEIRNHAPPMMLDNNEFSAWVDRVVTRASFRKVAPTMSTLRAFYAEKAKYGKPMKVGRLHHSGFRSMWNDLLVRVKSIASHDDQGNEQLQEARSLCYLLFRAVALHGKFENLLLFPALNAAKDDLAFTEAAIAQHSHEASEMNALLDRFGATLAEPPGQRAKALAALVSTCEQGRQAFFEHLDYEEENFMPVLSGLEPEQHIQLLRNAYEMCLKERPFLIGVLTSYMPIENTLSLIDSMLHVVEPGSEQWHLLLRAMHRSLSAEQWLRVVRRFEDVIPTSLMVVPSGHRRDSLAAAARLVHEAVPVDKIDIPISGA
jgi:glutathione S-transferase